MRLREIPLTAWIGILGILFAFGCAVFAPLIAPYGEREIVAGVWEPASDLYLLGTDNLGRDLLSRLIYGAQTTLFVSLAASILSFSIGIFLSFTAAVSGGPIDQGLSRLNDLMMSIPDRKSTRLNSSHIL